MNRRFPVLAGTFVLALLIVCATAAASPVSVSVRVEGAQRTLLPATTVTAGTPQTLIVKDGDPSHKCVGSSAAGALEFASRGAWSGKYFTSFNDYLVNTILGETPTGSSFWSFWLDDRMAQTGVCSTTVHTGDRVLFFVGGAASLVPLGLQTPSSAARGATFTVRVVKFAPSGKSTPVAGARVSGGGVSAVTGTGGRARLRVSRRTTLRLKATKTGLVRSEVETVRIR